jgi:hypothetical protein
MNRRSLCRPSLKITRSGDQTEANRFCVEVWNPFLHEYQGINSVEEGVARVDALASLIGRMWVERHRSGITLRMCRMRQRWMGSAGPNSASMPLHSEAMIRGATIGVPGQE